MKHVDDRPPSAPRVHGAAQTPLARQESVAAPKITRRSTNAWRAGRRRIDYQPTAGALAALEAYSSAGLQIKTIIDLLVIEGANAVARRRQASRREADTGAA